MLSIFAEAEADLGGSGSRDGEKPRGTNSGISQSVRGPAKECTDGGPRGPQINRPIGPWVISNALSIA